MRRGLIALFLITAWLAASLLAPTRAWAQSPTQPKSQSQPTGVEVKYTFGEMLRFKASLHSEKPVQEAWLLFRPEGETRAELLPVTVTPAGKGDYDLTVEFNLAVRPLRAFSSVSYHYEITFEGGDAFQSNEFSFDYNDNRLPWKEREAYPFRVHWVEGDKPFGQAVLDVAQLGLQQVQSLISADASDWIDIYAYPSARQMQATLAPSGQSWAAGHADPDLRMIVVALPASAEQRLLMEQRVPHELMHMMLYESLGKPYANLPTWFSEGLASFSELYPNPDYQIILDGAYQKERLLPFASLCQDFPQDVSSALLAYAQSASFTRYLYQTYGSSGIQALMGEYANGLDCQRGVESALGQGLNSLERQWQRTTFTGEGRLSPLAELLPWLAMLAAILAAPLALAFARPRRVPVHLEI